jgi:hypothetical protein
VAACHQPVWLRRRSEELAGWTRTLVWRAPLVAAAGLTGHVLAAQAGLPWAGLVGLVAAALLGWRLRFRPSEQARSWRRGAEGEWHKARLLDRLTRDGYVVFHDLAMPGNTSANVDHLVIGPTGVFVIDSKQWTGSVHQSADGLAWHHHSPLTGPWRRSAGKLRWSAACWAPTPPPGVRPRRPRPWRWPACPGRGHRACQPAPQRARL